MYTPTKEEVRAALKMHEKTFARTLEQWGMTKQAFDNLAERYELIMTVEDWEEELRMRQQRDQEGRAMYTPTKEEVRAALKTFSDYGDAFDRTLERWGMTRDQFDGLAEQYGLTLTIEDVLQDFETIQRVRREVEEESQTVQRPKKQGLFGLFKRNS